MDVPESHKDLLEGPVYSILTTINPDGEPENTVIWASWDGEHVLVNTARGRRKAENVQQNPHVALTAVDPDNPYRWIDIRGVVEDVVEDTNNANINKHARIYAGVDEYYGGVAPADRKNTEERIIFKITPEHVVAYGD